MKTSDRGLEALIAEEGEVLRAYRDVVGVITIGVGLTAKSGVIVPKMGMTITREESRRLLRLALSRTYEPEVEIAMSIADGGNVTRPAQHEFDAGVSFHFNTGAIARAGWVKLWKQKAGRLRVCAAMLEWSKAGGKVLPALKARRTRECALLVDGVYPGPSPAIVGAELARWGLQLAAPDVAKVVQGLQKLGYVAPGACEITLTEAKAFQAANGLTVDGILGRASLTTLQRLLDAKEKAVAPAAAATVTAGVMLSGGLDLVSAIPAQADTAAFVAAGVWLASHLWSYRTELLGWLMPAPNPHPGA